MITEQEKEKIRNQAKEILDNFALELDKIDLKKFKKVKEEKSKSKENKLEIIGVREERINENKAECDEEFRKLMFENAPKKEGDFILAEKKKW